MISNAGLSGGALGFCFAQGSGPTENSGGTFWWEGAPPPPSSDRSRRPIPCPSFWAGSTRIVSVKRGVRQA